MLFPEAKNRCWENANFRSKIYNVDLCAIMSLLAIIFRIQFFFVHLIFISFVNKYGDSDARGWRFLGVSIFMNEQERERERRSIGIGFACKNVPLYTQTHKLELEKKIAYAYECCAFTPKLVSCAPTVSIPHWSHSLSPPVRNNRSSKLQADLPLIRSFSVKVQIQLSHYCCWKFHWKFSKKVKS